MMTKTVAQQYPISVFLEKWENSKTYLIEVARAMPEDDYTYRPTERQMTFEEQLAHIQNNIKWLGTTYFSVKPIAGSTNANRKEGILETIAVTFDVIYKAIKIMAAEELKETVPFFAGSKTKWQLLNLLQDHVTHHRGQLIVYLNLKGIDPPGYVGW